MNQGTALETYDLYGILLGICILTAVVVFSAIFYSLLRSQNASGRDASKPSGSALRELIWAAIPCLIVVGAAYPATRAAIKTRAAVSLPFVFVRDDEAEGR